jgi:hypothetical protein
MGTFGVGLIVPGFDDDLDLFDGFDAHVGRRDTAGTEIAAAGEAQRFLEFLDTTSQDILDQLIVIRDYPILTSAYRLLMTGSQKPSR